MNREHYLSKRLHHQFQTPVDHAGENEMETADTLSSQSGLGKKKQMSVANASKRDGEVEPDKKSGAR